MNSASFPNFPINLINLFLSSSFKLVKLVLIKSSFNFPRFIEEPIITPEFALK